MKLRIVIILGCLFLILVVGVLIDSVNHSYSDSPEKSDVIIMLGGEGEERMAEAAELYKEGYAPYVLITPVIEEGRFNQSIEFAEELGIPEEAIITENEATSTYTNATISLDIMKEHDFDSALVVTSDYHIKRSKYIFDKENDNNFDLKYIPSHAGEGEKWYNRDDAFGIWRSEFIKTWGYRFHLYYFIDFVDEGEKYQ